MRFVDAVVYIYSNVKDRVSFGQVARNPKWYDYSMKYHIRLYKGGTL